MQPGAARGPFWATVGGLGLTGLILEATIRLRRIPSAWVRANFLKTNDLEETLNVLQERDRVSPYSVAWLDVLARGPKLGHGIVILGEWAEAEELRRAGIAEPYQTPAPRARRVRGTAPAWLINRWSMKLFNALYYALHRRGEALVDYRTFFYPLDAIRGWNKLYGKRGFLQYQCVFPEETSREGLAALLTAVAAEGVPSFLTVLKRFGPEGPGMLSFPRAGYTLALDFAVREAVFPFLRRLDEIVLRGGGRVYLAKDARLPRETLEAMDGERIRRWREVKMRYDPDGKFQSALSRRVGLTP